MKLLYTILKRDSKPCLRRIVQLNGEVIKERIDGVLDKLVLCTTVVLRAHFFGRLLCYRRNLQCKLDFFSWYDNSPEIRRYPRLGAKKAGGSGLFWRQTPGIGPRGHPCLSLQLF